MSTSVLLSGGIEVRVVTGASQNWLLGILPEVSVVIHGADQGESITSLLLQPGEDAPFTPWDWSWTYCPTARQVLVRVDDPNPPLRLVTVSAGGQRFVLVQLEGRDCDGDAVQLQATQLTSGQSGWFSIYPDSLSGFVYVLVDLEYQALPLRLVLLVGPRDGSGPMRRREIGIVA
jgi:hypothetical protein